MTKGWLALTDPDWYYFLSSRPALDEVNFWQPRGGRTFRALDRGEPLFFKLPVPERAIVGFGFFERFERLPAWLAWDSFGETNGAPDFRRMIDRIARLRREDKPVLLTGDFEIGCIMLSAPVFFGPTEWVFPPTDWPRSGIQQGKTYSLEAGEGRRMLEECLDRAQRAQYWNVEPVNELVASDSPRYGEAIPVRPRLGQGLFCVAVREAYAGACAVTHEHSVPVLEAAHIKDYASGGEHRVDNGMLLRRDLHRLYDRGYVTVTADYVFRVGARLRDEFKNGRSYYVLDGSKIALPALDRLRPNRDFLDWHVKEKFNVREGR